jgi:hypothetical protein
MMLHRDQTAKWVIGFLLFFVMLSGIGMALNMSKSTTIQIGSQVVQAKIVNSEPERSKGLSGTKTLKEGHGMLFVFDYSANWAIWMKDMHYSIDIIWLDETAKVVDIARNISPDTYPESFSPRQPARYVLEVPAGFADRYGIGINTLASFRH